MAPLYDFKNTKTGKEFEDLMTIAAKEQYLKDNPHIVQIHVSAPAICDSVRIGVRQPDNGFKEVMQKIHDKTPGSQLDQVTKL